MERVRYAQEVLLPRARDYLNGTAQRLTEKLNAATGSVFARQVGRKRRQGQSRRRENPARCGQGRKGAGVSRRVAVLTAN
jgi:hypothetical protein